MFTRIDHVTICVPDLAQGIEQYEKLGFNIYPGGAHPGSREHAEEHDMRPAGGRGRRATVRSWLIDQPRRHHHP